LPAETAAKGDIARIADGLSRIGAGAGDDVAELAARLADAGVLLAGKITAPVLAAAQKMRSMNEIGRLMMILIVPTLALIGLFLSLRTTHPQARARDGIERVVLGLLIAAALLAILTTLGIIGSLLFETISFFRLHPWQDFFVGDTWSPNFRGDSQLAILPLL